MSSFIRTALFGVIFLTGVGPNRSEAQSSRQYRLGVSVTNATCGIGVKVDSVVPGSPATRLKLAANHSITRSLIAGDWITAANGATLQNVAHLRQVLNDCQGYVVLSVKSSTAGGCGEWVVQGKPGGDEVPGDGVRRVHLVMAGSTADQGNGAAAAGSLTYFEESIKAEFDASQLTVTKCIDQSLKVKDITEMISQIQSDADDTILWFSHTHGAHAPDAKDADTSKGHFLNMADGDVLYRYELLQHLQRKSHRLLVIATEACNSEAVPPREVKLRMEQRARTITGMSPMARLLLYHRGVIDVNAAKAGQPSWNTGGNPVGLSHPIGVFSFFFTGAIRSAENWDKLVTGVDENARDFVYHFWGKSQDLAVFQKLVTQDQLPQLSTTDTTNESSFPVFIYEEIPANN